MFKFFVTLFPLAVCRVYAFPLSRTSTSKTYYIPLVVLSVFLFFLLVAIKLVYMKQRRIGTIHAPPVPFASSSTSLRDKETNRHRGLVVGCLGSPAWETNLTATAWRRRSSRDTLSTCSTCACTQSTVTTLDGNQFVLSSGHLRVASSRGRNRFRCGDFGEPRGLGFPGNSVVQGARRASPSSIRLVDGPGHSGQVEYAFLTGLPPTALLASPLTSTRDSFQLSRCSLKCDRKPVPPLPPLPSYLVLHPPKDEEVQSPGDGYLPGLLFSPFVSVTGTLEQALERRMPSNRSDDPGAGSLHDKGTAPLRLVRQTKSLAATDVGIASRNGKPLKSCLRQSLRSPSINDTRKDNVVE